jgi:hypothetical protein
MKILALGLSIFRVGAKWEEAREEGKKVAEEGVRDGSVGVFQGRVKVSDPAGGGRPATLAPGPGTRVLVNGQEIKGPTPVTTSDTIEVETITEAGSAKVKVEIAPDGLTATASCEVVPDRRHILLDSVPRCNLTLATRVEEVNPTVSTEDVLKALRAKGVVLGVDEKAVAALAANPSGPPQVVARGTPPTPGQDAWIELKFEEGGGLKVPQDDVQKVDWRELSHIPTVEAGAELAVKHPPVPGKAGQSVTGAPVEPPAPKDVELCAGEGCEVVDGLRVVATRSGRPTVARGCIEVLPILVQDRGVNLASGNIKFSGDVVVKGNVEDTMTVQAGGNIEVKGSATHAFLMAGGQIVVRDNMIGGLARAGGVGVVHLRCRGCWEELAQGLEDCAAALTQIAHHPEFGPAAARQGWGRVLQRLLDTKFRSLTDRLRDLSAAYREVEGILTGDVEKVLERLRNYLTGRGALALNDIEEWMEVTRSTRALAESLKEQRGLDMSFQARYVQGARIEASGDIVITGQGCYQSYLYAGRNLRVLGKPGVIRGGVAEARQRIMVNEAGSTAGSPTLLKVDARGVIEVGTVHPNVTIQVGNMRHKFDVGDAGVNAHLDADGQLVLH